MLLFDVIAGMCAGLCLGSWFGCVAWRLPRRIPLTGRSHCPSCGHQLAAWENVPALSWLALRGCTACCKTPLSARYLVLELATGALGAGLGALTGLAGIVVLFLVGVAGPLVWSLATVSRED